jgi:hypothetical protein
MIKLKNNVLSVSIDFNRIKCSIVGHKFITKIGTYRNGTHFKIKCCERCCYITHEIID